MSGEIPKNKDEEEKDLNLADTDEFEVPEELKKNYGPKDYHTEILDRGREKIKVLREKLEDLSNQVTELRLRIAFEEDDEKSKEMGEKVAELLNQESKVRKETENQIKEIEEKTKQEMNDYFKSKRESENKDEEEKIKKPKKKPRKKK